MTIMKKRILALLTALSLMMALFSLTAVASEGSLLQVTNITRTSVMLSHGFNGEYDGVQIYRALTIDGEYTKISDVLQGTNTYMDTNVQLSKTYFYNATPYMIIDGQKQLADITSETVTAVMPVNGGTKVLGIGEKFTMPTGTAVSEDTRIAAISGTTITAVSAGTTYVLHTGTDKKTVYQITVKPAPGSITLNKTTLTMGVAETFSLVGALPSGTASSKISYTSSSTTVATVDSTTGKITAKKEGTATITAKTFNGKSATCKITVKKAPTSFSINKTTLLLGLGESFTLKTTLSAGAGVASYSYTNSNSAVVSLNTSTGAVKALKEGSSKITIKIYNGKTVTCTVTVKKAPTSATLNKTSMTLYTGDAFDLNCSIPAGTGCTAFTYTSSNTSVAPVDATTGMVTAKKAGTATITVKTYNGKKATCKVTIKTAPTKSVVNATTIRASASWASASKCSVKKGVKVSMLTQSGRWLKVKYGSNVGYIYNKAFSSVQNYSSITTSTLPVVVDDILFKTGTGARGIFDYCRAIKYQSLSNDSVANLCVYALKYKKGSCYHHAALLHYMLQRSGYQSMMIMGIGYSGGPHNWVLVKYGSSWRHLDATKYRSGVPEIYYKTDSFVDDYFSWDRSKYPACK